MLLAGLIQNNTAQAAAYTFKWQTYEIANAFDSRTGAGTDTMNTVALYDLFARPVICGEANASANCWNTNGETTPVPSITLAISPTFSGTANDDWSSSANPSVYENTFRAIDNPNTASQWARMYDLPLSGSNYGLISFVTRISGPINFASVATDPTFFPNQSHSGAPSSPYNVPMGGFFEISVNTNSVIGNSQPVQWIWTVYGIHNNDTKHTRYTFYMDGYTAPEPGSMLLLGGGLAALLWRKRSRRQPHLPAAE